MQPGSVLAREVVRIRKQPWFGGILAAIVAVIVVMGFAVAPSVMRGYGESKKQIAQLTANKYVFDAYPRWRATHPRSNCPDQLAALDAHMASKPIHDPWGGQYQMLCDERRGGIAVYSNGEDGVLATADDVWSPLTAVGEETLARRELGSPGQWLRSSFVPLSKLGDLVTPQGTR